MGIKKVLSALAVFAFLFCGTGLAQQKQEDSGTDPELVRKIDEVIRAQKEIMDSLKSVKEELNVVKIRVTQRQ